MRWHLTRRFSTKLVLLICMVFLIPVATSLALLLATSRASIARFDQGIDASTTAQQELLDEILPRSERSDLGSRELLILLRSYEKRRSLGQVAALVVISFALAGVVFLLSLIMLKRGMLSLRELSVAAKAVGDGHFDVAPVARSADEFAELTRAFSTMTQRLRETVVRRDFFNQVIESMPAGVFTLDARGMISTWNRHAEILTGLKQEEVVGRAASAFQEVIGHVPPEGELPFFSREAVIRPRIGGQRIISKGMDFLYGARGEHTGVIATFIDISGLKLLERQLVIAKEMAEESSRLRSEFLANMSHEIRTPLNGIIGLAEVLHDEESDQERRESLEKISQCGKNLLHIINEILDLSKIEAGKMVISPSMVSTADLLREAASSIEIAARRKGILLSTEIAQGVPKTIEVDDRKLLQILINLMGNALKFTEQGFIRVSVEPYAGERPGNLIFGVADSGIGIPAARQKHIFESFIQVEHHLTRTSEGTGLGLPISKKLIELMGGQIWLESEEGKGTTFRFTIDTESRTP